MSRKAYLLAALVAIVAIFVAIDINRERFYVFDPEVLHKVASEVGTMNISTKAKIDRVVSELAKIYPKYIDTHEEWIFNVAAGAMGHMTLLHCSITEYIMIFGSAIGTEGYSGRYMSDDYFSIIEGEQHSYFVGELEPRIYRPGSEVNLMPRGVATGYKMPHKTYALEYARGNIPSMLPTGFADTIFSTVDYIPLIQTVYHYARITIGQLLIGKI